ncbi:MAG TPA: sulfurtransferase [Thermomicrobiales bacterium]|nr:sulfurtransferase [Thermomicrobiales bacterium]
MTAVTNLYAILAFVLIALFLTPVTVVSNAVPATVVAAPGQAAETATPIPESGFAHPDLLVDADWLVRHLHDPGLKVVALTAVSNFENGHIPGAAQINWTDLGLADTTDPAIAKWQGAMEQTLTRLGIAPSDTVVIYDDGTLYAPRLWWILDQLGHKDKRILNGGLDAWTQAGGALEKGASNVQPATSPYKATPNTAAIATLDEVKADLDNPNVILVDARTPAEYVAGHIPGAINIPFTDNAVSGKPKVWKSAADLRAMYEAVGVTPDKTVIPYCSTGVRSAATYFTLVLLGYPHVSLYTGSWDEWSKHPDLPTTIGKKP